MGTRTFTVEGRGDFPADMMRRDRCSAVDTDDETAIAATYENQGNTGRRRVRLVTEERMPNEDRWRSFGWPVVEGGDRNKPEPYRVVASVHSKSGRTVTTDIDIDRLDVEGPIVGRLADAVSTLVKQEPGLKGSEPHLYNALMGVFARVRWRMEDAFRAGGAVDDISTKIAWNEAHDIQIEIR